MTMSWRGFRFQTGEMEEILSSITENGSAEVDIDEVEEVDMVLADLEQNGVKKTDIPYDFSAVDTEKNPDFYARIFFEKDVYIDFYHVDQKEEDYDEIFWG